VFWDIILTTDADINAIKDVFIFVEDLADVEIEITDGMIHSEEDNKRLGQILVERGDLRLEDLKEALKDQKRIGEILVDRGMVSPDKVQAALSEQEQIRKKKEKQQSEESISSIRVALRNLIRLSIWWENLLRYRPASLRKQTPKMTPISLLLPNRLNISLPSFVKMP
jgi:two-component system chemotaxis sensor kinase CheA